MYLLILLLIIIVIYLIWKDDKKKKKDEYELKIINDPTINLFNLEKHKFWKLSNIFFVPKFKDFVVLSDFNNNAHNFNYDNDYSTIRNNYYIIDKYLLFELISYKRAFQNIEERIKLEYMCWYTGKSIKYNEIEYDYDIKDVSDEIDNNKREGKKYKKWQNIREAIIKRDNSICVLCGDDLRHSDIHIHHITYRKDGGDDNYNNLVTLCVECHATLPDHDKVIEFAYKLSTYYSRINQNKRIKENIGNKNKKLLDEIVIDTISRNPLINILGKDFYSKIILDKNLLSEIFFRADPLYQIMKLTKNKKLSV